MPASPDDDFSAFHGQEHMFFGLKDPLGMIRSEEEDALRGQIADSELVAIQTSGQPKFLTLGRKASDGETMVVTHFGFAVRAKLTVLFDQRRKGEVLESLLTFLFADVDTNQRRFRRFFDLHEEAERAFDDEQFKQRFLAFRHAEN
jgi:hypothetical protein